MRLPKALPCLLLLLLSGAVAQTDEVKPEVNPVYIGDVFIVVTPVRPHHGERAEIETYARCLRTATGEPAANQHAAIAPTYFYSEANIDQITIRLSRSLDASSKLCVIENIYAEDDKEHSYVLRSRISLDMTPTKRPEGLIDAALPPPAPYLVGDLYVEDGAIIVMPVLPRKHERATIRTYRNCSETASGVAKDQYADIATLQPVSHNDTGPFVIQLEHRLVKDDTVCVIEYFYDKKDAKNQRVGKKEGIDKASRSLVSEVKTASKTRTEIQKARFPSKQSKRTYARVTTGVDVSAAASADPAAHFMADLSFDVPFSNHNASLYKLFSANGYLRLASIAQPGKINGIATPATYIKPLTDSTPNSLVQSWEGDVAFAMRATPRLNLGEQDAYWTISGIVDGGFITPISADQTTTAPVVYVANKAIYDFYTRTPVVNAPAAKAISDACVIPASGPFPTCYVSYVTQDRTRFFRNYAVGVTFKRYRYQGADNVGKPYQGDDKFDFPGTATIKIGQNEYVTKGLARGLVLHGDFFWPIHSVLKGNWTGPLYVFGQIDEHLSGNESSQQFILETAGSAITRTSANVAIIPVQQPDRDRYRFGVAVDLGTLLKAITPGRD